MTAASTIPVESVALASIDHWLANKGCTLWADWDLSRPDRRMEAAQWFLRQMTEWVESKSPGGVRSDG